MMNPHKDLIDFINYIKDKLDNHINSCCDKKHDDSPLSDAIKVYGDYIKVADGSYYLLSQVENFDIEGSSIKAFFLNSGCLEIYDAESPEQAKKVLDGLMNALCIQKYQHINEIVSQFKEINERLRFLVNKFEVVEDK